MSMKKKKLVQDLIYSVYITDDRKQPKPQIVIKSHPKSNYIKFLASGPATKYPLCLVGASSVG